MAAIGIDFGTANVRVAILKMDRPLLVEDTDGSSTIPAVVSFDPKGARVGLPALKRAWSHADTTARGAKRVLGRTFEEPIVKAYACSASIVADKGARVLLGAGGKAGSPDTSAGVLLTHLLKLATERLGSWPTSAVICAPAWFGERQRAALRGVAKEAGLAVSRIVSEPVAAAVRLVVPGGPERRVAVIDVGAGGIGVAVLVTGRAQLRIAGEAGEGLIGGDDFDALLMKAAMTQLTDQVGFVVPTPATLEMLRQSCEEMKIELSSGASVTRSIPYVQSQVRGEAPPTLTFTRAKMEPLFADIVAGVVSCFKSALATAQLESNALDAVFFNGGMLRIPGLRVALEEVLGHRAATGLDPGASPALGAALLGASLARQTAPILLEEGPAPANLRAKASPPVAEPAPTSSERAPDSSAPVPSAPAPSGPAPSASVPSAPVPSAPAPTLTTEPDDEFLPLPGPEPSPPVDPLALTKHDRPSFAAITAPTTRTVSNPRIEVAAPSSRQSNMPSSSALIPREVGRGKIKNASDAAGVLGLAIMRPIVEEDLEPIALPVLLVRVLSRKHVSGTLTLSDGKKQFSLVMMEGFAYLRPQEHPSLHQAFSWPSGTYTFDTSPPVPGRREKFAMARLAMDGLRMQARAFSEPSMEDLLGAKLLMSPIVKPERKESIKRLVSDGQETRFIEFNFDGTRSARDLAVQSGVSHTTLRLLVLLSAFEALDWQTIAVSGGESVASVREKRASKISIRRSEAPDPLPTTDRLGRKPS